MGSARTTIDVSTLSLGRLRKQSRLREAVIQRLLLACALISVFTTIGIVIILVVQAAGFFSKVSILEFFTGT
ncbi:MAG: Phosphate transport system permease protein, partial [Dehalococcoidia bacterium]|nr:Phosphate transport system permease protein [Dehalococcoidia bacterium]